MLRKPQSWMQNLDLAVSQGFQAAPRLTSSGLGSPRHSRFGNLRYVNLYAFGAC